MFSTLFCSADIYAYNFMDNLVLIFIVAGYRSDSCTAPVMILYATEMKLELEASDTGIF
jgi:hypothetical protein